MKRNSLWFAGGLVFLVWTLLAGAPERTSEQTSQDLKGFDREIVQAEEARRLVEQGKFFLRDKNQDKARELFEKAIVLDKRSLEARFQLGRLEKDAGRYHLAVEHLEVVYRETPARDSLCLMLSESYLGLGDCGAARAWLERQQNRKPGLAGTASLERRIKDCLKRNAAPHDGKK